MKLGKGSVIFHPLRIRLVQALFGGRRLSPRQLLEVVEGTSIASLYRHLNTLADAGVVKVVEERQARGATERFYALADETAADISEAQLRHMSPEEHLRHFTTFIGTLLNDYGSYLSQPRLDVAKDAAQLRQEAVNLTRQEAHELAESLRRAIARHSSHSPSKSRRRYLVTTIMFPDTGSIRHNAPEGSGTPE